jgi:prolipoprotein diacylglyceryltransferase
VSPQATLFFPLWVTGGCVGFLAALAVVRYRGCWSARATIALLAAWFGMAVGAKWQFRLEHLPAFSAFAPTPLSLNSFISPGHRLPLGLFIGGVLGAIACLVLRVPWREAGDAFVVGVAVMKGIGRFGCVAAGCCMGLPCSSWLRPFCPRYPPLSQAYNRQIADHLIELGAPWSLPAHPLSVYYLATGWLLVLCFVRLLRRGGQPGSLLAAFGILWPVSRFVLEPLRAAPRSSGLLMFGVPAIIFFITCIMLIAHRCGRTVRALSLSNLNLD